MAVSVQGSSSYVNKEHKRPWKVLYYPKKTVFRKADLIDKGCVIFLKMCPRIYKQNSICARHYDGEYQTFANYCEMEYENCNSWRKWSMVKRTRC
ncbi:hypothetical protein B5X24_HaOG202241 [Helicoverpa armigera]|uniref:Kazal-like domain-containing protein n=1 Tax=Helicoverpa armigera TaxID=29058 RepID=A0A2W1BXG6_HELAM|nr:hypothetical protein B5X24_HaOG202241 [Helicoverpa armigera]